MGGGPDTPPWSFGVLVSFKTLVMEFLGVPADSVTFGQFWSPASNFSILISNVLETPHG